MPPRKRIGFPKLGKSPQGPPPPRSDSLLRKESFDERRLAAETKRVELQTDLQAWITRFIPRAVKSWLILLLVFILADSISLTWTWHGSYPRIESFDFDIDTYVMVALVGSITLAVGGLVNFALKGLLGKTQE